MAPPSDPHEGGDLFDMAKDGTTMPNDAGKHNLIPSVPRPDQIADDSTDPGAADLASAADNPTDIPRRHKDIGTTGEVLTGTGDQLPAQVESKRLHMGANEPFSKGHDRMDKHRRQKESDLERYAGEGAGVDEVPGEEEEVGREEVRERRDGKEVAEPSDTGCPNASETAFENFRHWLYQKQLTSPNRPNNGAWDRLRLKGLIELYTLTDFLCVSTLRNLITDTLNLISLSIKAFRRAILHVASNQISISTLLRLLVRMYANHVTSAGLRRVVADWMGPDFHVKLTTLLLEDVAKGKGKKLARKAAMCEYHVHDKNSPQCN